MWMEVVKGLSSFAAHFLALPGEIPEAYARGSEYSARGYHQHLFMPQLSFDTENDLKFMQGAENFGLQKGEKPAPAAPTPFQQAEPTAAASVSQASGVELSKSSYHCHHVCMFGFRASNNGPE